MHKVNYEELQKALEADDRRFARFYAQWHAIADKRGVEPCDGKLGEVVLVELGMMDSGGHRTAVSYTCCKEMREILEEWGVPTLEGR